MLLFSRRFSFGLELFKHSTMRTTPTHVTEGLVKNNLAAFLRTEIMDGVLQPGERIVEGKWSAKLGVAQGSIREAINLLALEGFVTKRSGRSARVVNFTEQDVVQLYQLRGAIEGLAARLASSAQPDLSSLQVAVDGMRDSAAAGNRESLLDCDLQFHLQLCTASGNPFVLQQARRILLPFFAFVRMRVAASGQETSVWSRDLEAHQRIIDLISEGEGEVAEHYIKKAMDRFARTAYDNWERRS
jgi:DNA-binding GntR family transcriptional regulator